jgi:uncharacterized protein
MLYERPTNLYDRENEWSDLVAFAAASQPGLGLGIVYGRRRFGKSFLLRRLVESVGGVYHLALEEARTPALARFASAVGNLYTPALPASFEDWDQALRSAVTILGHRETPQLLVLDEYPYLRSQSPELDSVIQALIDDVAGGGFGAEWRSRVSIVLCGSALSVMTELLSGTAPLRGRASLDLPLGVFDYRQSADFWQIDDPHTAFHVDSILGGAAGYRDLVAGTPTPLTTSDLPDWVARTVLNPSHALFREDEYLLREDPRVSKEAVYYSILGAVASGKSSQREIAAALGRTSVDIGYQLGVLISAGFITRDEDLLVKQNPVFRVADPIVRFHELVTRRHQALLEDRLAARVWELSQPTFSSKITGAHFETIARTWVSRYASIDTLGGPIGSVRALTVNDPQLRTSFELDVVATTLGSAASRRKTMQLIGEAKGSSSPRTVADLKRLDHLAELLSRRSGVTMAPTAKKFLFGMRGFDTDLSDAAARRPDVELVDLSRLYGGD